MSTDIFYSLNGDTYTWITNLDTDEDEELEEEGYAYGSYAWDTTQFEDGTELRIKVRIFSDG